MLFPKLALFFSLLALFRIVVASFPPACFLKAAGSQPNPADFATICGPNASKFETQISESCYGDDQVALKAFSSVCASAGHKIVTQSSASSSSSSSGTVSVTGSATNSGSATVTATDSASSSGNGSSGSDSPPSQATFSSSSSVSSAGVSSNRQASVAAFAAVVFFGFAASL